MFPSAKDDSSAEASLQRPMALDASVAYIDGRYVPVRDASIPILDWGFLHSDATYDVTSVWKGSFFRLHDHIDRFFASARSLRLDVGIDPAAVASTLTECVRRSRLRDAYVEMVVTRGLPAQARLPEVSDTESRPTPPRFSDRRRHLCSTISVPGM